jgi:Lysophospholipase L1 and related esterases
MKRLVLLLLCTTLLACGVNVSQEAQSAPTSEPTSEPTQEPTPEPTPVEESVEAILSAHETPAASLAPVPTDVPTPTPKPTAAPTPTPKPEIIDAERLASGEFDSYFDDAVFVGDSITSTLRNYVTGQRARHEGFLGTAQFLGVTSMSAFIAASNKIQKNGINFRYRGKEMTFTAALQKTGAKKVFLLLGVNELVWCKWEDELAAFEKIFGLIRSVEPDAEIVVQAVLPVTSAYSKKQRIKIDKWNSFNIELQALCERNEVTFFSFAEQVMDENGYLARSLSNDGAYHLNEKGNDIWINALRKYAAAQTYPDAIFVSP